jgi:hypothetical protein
MAEDRDQLFEKALARHLRSDGAEETLCLDPETLAAYHERMLSVEEMSAAKTHVASCARCQEILAQLEVTQEISNAREEPAGRLVASPIRTEYFVESAFDEAQTPSAAAAASPKMLIRISSKRRRIVAWAVPAGALAAGLWLWLGIQRSGKNAAPAAETVQVAEGRTAPAANEEYSQALKAVPLDDRAPLGQKQKELRREEPPGAPAFSSRERKKDAGADKSLAVQDYKTRQHVAPPSTSTMAQSASGPSAARSQAQAADAINRTDAVVSGQMSEQAEVAPSSSELDAGRVAAKAAPGVGGGRAVVGGAPTAAPAPPPSPPSPRQSARAEVVMRNQAVNGRDYETIAPALSKTAVDIRITSPGSKNIWSIGPNGKISFSEDGGKVWAPQFSGVSANLTGGSAPSDQVCWIVGTAGTLLRTTDGGKTWQILRTPISGDLSGVHAVDAQRASIWDVPNRIRYDTSDGGATWKQKTNE